MIKVITYNLYAGQVLIAAGADVDLQIERGNVDLWDTALHIAVYHGQLPAGGQAIQNIITCILKDYK